MSSNNWTRFESNAEEKDYLWNSRAEMEQDLTQLMSFPSEITGSVDLSSFTLEVWGRTSKPRLEIDQLKLPRHLTSAFFDSCAQGLGYQKVGRGSGLLNQYKNTDNSFGGGPGPKLTNELTRVLGMNHRLDEIERKYGGRKTKLPGQRATNNKSNSQSIVKDEDFPRLT